VVDEGIDSSDGTRPKDDNAAPQEPEFYDKINKSIHFGKPRGNAQSDNSSTRNLPSQPNQVIEKAMATTDIYDVPDSEPDTGSVDREVEAPNATQAQQHVFDLRDNQSPPKPTLRAESPLFVPDSPQDGNVRRSRSRSRASLSDKVHETPRSRSQDLGTEMSFVATSQPQPKRMDQNVNKKTQEQPPQMQPNEDENEDATRSGFVQENGDGGQPSLASPVRNDQRTMANIRNMMGSILEESFVEGEDSLMFTAQRQDASLTTVSLSSKSLQDMLLKMGSYEWTHERTDWQKKMLPSKGEDKKKWLRRHTRGLSGATCQRLFILIHYLWILCHEMPRAPDIGGQEEYIRSQEENIQKAITTIHSTVDKITDRQSSLTQMSLPEEQKWAAETAKWLCGKIIPMLVLLLKEVFMVGGRHLEKAEAELPDEGDFTLTVLEILQRIIGWTSRLAELMSLELDEILISAETRPFAEAERRRLRVYASRRHTFSKLAKEFGHRLEQANTDLDDRVNGTQRKVAAKERDRLVREVKQEKARKLNEAAERQMQLFFASTQNAGGSQGRNTLRTSNQIYHIKQKFDDSEDARLLGWIRKVGDPEYNALIGQFPGRSGEELRQRGEEIKTLVRQKYAASNMAPPTWCYSQHKSWTDDEWADELMTVYKDV
jgi:hypothetical protein